METTTSPAALTDPALVADSPQTEARPLETIVDMCPVQEAIKIVGRKWHLIILWELSKHPHGFNELKGATKGISAKMLSQSLGELEDHGLVVRQIVSERPLRVSYSLTDKARELAFIFEVLYDWGDRHGICDSLPKQQD